MTSYVGLSPQNPTKYLGPNVRIISIVTRNREPTGADYRQPETGKLYPIGSEWIISKDPTNGSEGDLWYLSKIVSNVAFWIKVSSGTDGPLIDIIVDAATTPGVNPVDPTSSGEMTFHGAAVSNHSVPLETRTRALNTINYEIQYATTADVSTPSSSGIAHFNDDQFSVDANGFVSSIVSGFFTWQDTSGLVTAVVNIGYFITNTCTSTLPAAPSQGDTVRYFVNTTNILTIQASGAQVIQLANSASSAGGTATNTQKGDAIELVYNTASDQWCAVNNPSGAWTLA